MAVVTVDDVRSVIHSFLEKITEEQWILLKEGTPDDATMYLLAEMITEFIIFITNTILANLRSKDADVCKEELLNSLNKTLHKSFVQALEFTEEMQSVSSESLTKLIAKEVAESVNSALSASTDSESRDFVVPHDKVGGFRVTPSRRLNTMVGHASDVLRDFMTKVKSLCPPQPRRSRSYRVTDVENTDKEDMVPPMESPEHEDAEIEDLETSDEEMEEDKVERPDTGDRLESPVKSERQDTPEKMASEDSFLAQTSKAVQEIIRQELYELTEPVLHTVEESEYELLQSDFSLEIEVIGDDISQILTEEAKSLQHSETESPREENNLKSKIKTLFAKLFAKSLIHRMVAQLKSKYHKIFKGKGRHSAQSLRSSVESLLLDEYDITEGGNEVSVFRQLEIISSGKHLVFTKELSDLIYSHIRDGMVTTDNCSLHLEGKKNNGGFSFFLQDERKKLSPTSHLPISSLLRIHIYLSPHYYGFTSTYLLIITDSHLPTSSSTGHRPTLLLTHIYLPPLSSCTTGLCPKTSRGRDQWSRLVTSLRGLRLGLGLP
ncbi:uncharacterized protein LOC121906661 isoform X2 [Thunnus maccoyii]|uniref:uncharacterized protein LOC121906661 isoform X2 n=1 Tax=Thunnus maccoyii TaxID=8240 RepID=UPI001C4B8D20|nr:uncharacterized protein LOC121906661 isoform X2 [Thunnus maccoyii]